MTIRTITLVFTACCVAVAGNTYVLGPDDQIVVQARSAQEFPQTPLRIDGDGYIDLPLIGRVQAEGKTLTQLERDITNELKRFVWEPDVTISIAEFRARSVSIFGAVTRPGLLHLRGPKTLSEALSEAGGFSNEVGEFVRIARRRANGPLPLESARVDETGEFMVADISVDDLRKMNKPELNIELLEKDVISVSAAEIIYVVGHVARPGGFTTKGTITLLETLSRAGGFLPNAKATQARLLRVQPGSDQRKIIAVNLKRVLKGEDEDFALEPQDILFVPHNAWKQFGLGLAQSAAAAASASVVYATVREGRY